MTDADLIAFSESLTRTADHLRAMPLKALAGSSVKGERSRAHSALAVAQMIADFDSVLRDTDDAAPADDDVQWAGEAAVGDQLAAVGREFLNALSTRDLSADEPAAAMCTAATDALLTLRMEL
ncbi:MAG: hypothetical protein EBS41_04530 [Actinobacteria bacterium]|nr:hypothetical protein [Actinomycetota bacterium]